MNVIIHHIKIKYGFYKKQGLHIIFSITLHMKNRSSYLTFWIASARCIELNLQRRKFNILLILKSMIPCSKNLSTLKYYKHMWKDFSTSLCWYKEKRNGNLLLQFVSVVNVHFFGFVDEMKFFVSLLPWLCKAPFNLFTNCILDFSVKSSFHYYVSHIMRPSDKKIN